MELIVKFGFESMNEHSFKVNYKFALILSSVLIVLFLFISLPSGSALANNENKPPDNQIENLNPGPATLKSSLSNDPRSEPLRDDFDEGLGHWVNGGHPTPSTFQSKDFEDRLGYATNGDEWFTSGSLSEFAVDLTEDQRLEFRVRDRNGSDHWDFIQVGFGWKDPHYGEAYKGFDPYDHFTQVGIGVKVNGGGDFIRYKARGGESSDKRPNDGKFHVYRIEWDASTNTAKYYQDDILKYETTVTDFSSWPVSQDQVRIAIRGRDYQNTNYLDWIRYRAPVLESAWDMGSTPSGPQDTGSEASVNEYESISESDGAFWKTGKAGGDDYNSQMFKFNTPESSASVSNLLVGWEGYGEGKSNYDTRLEIWNYKSSGWETLWKKDGMGSESLLTAQLNNTGDYISSNGDIHVMARAKHEEGGGGKNPFLYGWNGKSYELLDTAFTKAGLRIFKSTSYSATDLLKPENGRYKLNLYNPLPDNSHLDKLSLKAVAHPKGTELLPDYRGGLHTIKNSYPISAVDETGKDISDLLNEPDNQHWSSDLEGKKFDNREDLRDIVTVQLPKKKPTNLVLRLRESKFGMLKAWSLLHYRAGTPNYPKIVKMIEENEKLAKLAEHFLSGQVEIRVQYWDSGKWIDYDVIPQSSFLFNSKVLPINVPTSKVRFLFPAGMYELDYLAADYTPDEDIRVTDTSPIEATKHPTDGDATEVLAQIKEVDNKYAHFSQGEYVNVQFPVVSKNENSERSYVISANGYFDMTGPKVPKNKMENLTQLLEFDPFTFMSWLVPRYLNPENYPLSKYFPPQRVEEPFQTPSSLVTDQVEVRTHGPIADLFWSPQKSTDDSPWVDELTDFLSYSQDPDDDLSSWTWSFGDDGQAEKSVTVHSYGSKGTYEVELTAEDGNGLKSSRMKKISVEGREWRIGIINFDWTYPVSGTEYIDDYSGEIVDARTLQPVTVYQGHTTKLRVKGQLVAKGAYGEPIYMGTFQDWIGSDSIGSSGQFSLSGQTGYEFIEDFPPVGYRQRLFENPKYKGGWFPADWSRPTWFEDQEPSPSQTEANLIGSGEHYRFLSPSTSDWTKIHVRKDSNIRIVMTPPSNSNFDLYLQGPSGSVVASSTLQGDNKEEISYTISETGYHYIEVRRVSGFGVYRLNISGVEVTTPPKVPKLYGRGKVWSSRNEPTWTWSTYSPEGEITRYEIYRSWTGDTIFTSEEKYSPILEDGRHFIRVRAQNNGGYWSDWSENAWVYIDTALPESVIDPIENYWHNASNTPLELTATASDPVPTSDATPSGVENVSLYYRYSEDNKNWSGWKLHEVDGPEPYSWSFDPPKGDGYYEFYTIAKDTAGNKEEPPQKPDARIGVDTVKPKSHVDEIENYWHNTRGLPVEASATATDHAPSSGAEHSGIEDVELYYRYSTDNTTWSTWRLFKTDKEPPYNWPFDAPEGDGYYELRSIARDVAGNEEDSPENADERVAVDTTPPSSPVNPIEPYWRENVPFGITASATDNWTRNDEFVVGIGVENVTLFYRSSRDDENWTEWKLFGTDNERPYSWQFDAPHRYALYEFYSVATDELAHVENVPENADAEVGAVIPAEVDIDPDTLNLKSNGKWVTSYIELPHEYGVKPTGEEFSEFESEVGGDLTARQENLANRLVEEAERTTASVGIELEAEESEVELEVDGYLTEKENELLKELTDSLRSTEVEAELSIEKEVDWEKFDPTIQIGTVRLENVPAVSDQKYGFVKNPELKDRDESGLPELMVKFPLSEVQTILQEGTNTLTITGKDIAVLFEGWDTIRAISPGHEDEDKESENGEGKEKGKGQKSK